MYFAIIGNDARMDYVAERLYSLGCEVSRDLNKLNKGANIIIPPPVNNNYCDILEQYIDNISVIYGGCICRDFMEKFQDNCKIIDYLTWDFVIEENAKLTAQGIIKEAIGYNACFLEGQILVTGFGYCGKAIAFQLKNMGGKVTVAVRNNKLKQEILTNGFDFIDIRNMCNDNMSRFDCIFNTVPALIITRQVIDMLNSASMIFDIASRPGGVDFEYCKEKKIFSVLSLGIPGRDFPKEAGYLIGNACFNHFNSLS